MVTLSQMAASEFIHPEQCPELAVQEREDGYPRGLKRRASAANLDSISTPTVPTKSSYIGKNAVMLVYELYKSVKFTVDVKGSIATFLATLHVDGATFQGEGRSKQLAKYSAAVSALQTLKGFQFNENGHIIPGICAAPNGGSLDDSLLIPPDPHLATKVPSGPSTIRSQEFADRVCRLVCEQLLRLEPVVGETYTKYKVLAGIVLTYRGVEDQQEEMQLLCLTTGTKCLSGNHMTSLGNAMVDCHAEIVARRCFMRFLLQEMHNLESHGPEASQVLRFLDADEVSGMSGPRYALRDGVQFHLYISSAPCGDSRIFTVSSSSVDLDSDISPEIGDHPLRRSRGLLRTKIENGEGAIPTTGNPGPSGNQPQTWDGVVGGERFLTMSCSDKCLLWNCVGLQGALLSGLLARPVYLDSIVLSAIYEESHLRRALYGRLRHLNTLPAMAPVIESGFALHAPQVFLASSTSVDSLSLEEKNSNKSPNHSLNWICGGDDNAGSTEVVACLKGMGVDSGAPSRLCKLSLLREVVRLLQRVSGDFSSPQAPYSVLKMQLSHPSYFALKKILYSECARLQLGGWSTKPVEMELFCIEPDKTGEEGPEIMSDA